MAVSQTDPCTPRKGSKRFKKMPRSHSSSMKPFANEKTSPHTMAAPSNSMLCEARGEEQERGGGEVDENKPANAQAQFQIPAFEENRPQVSA